MGTVLLPTKAPVKALDLGDGKKGVAILFEGPVLESEAAIEGQEGGRVLLAPEQAEILLKNIRKALDQLKEWEG